MKERGGALLAALVLIVLVAAGAALLLPPALRHVDQVEAEQLDHRLEAWVLGLRAFHRDIGRFPTTGEGLDALRNATGDPRWRGPYVAPDLSSDDPWGEPLAYSTPGGDSARVASASLTGDARVVEDDADVAARAARTAAELEVIVAAADRYRTTNGVLPSTMSQLAAGWVGGDYLVDAWGNSYSIGGGQVASAGADGQPGTGDDVVEALP